MVSHPLIYDCALAAWCDSLSLSLSVVVDGVEWTEVSSIRVVANVGQCVTIATKKHIQTSTEAH